MPKIIVKDLNGDVQTIEAEGHNSLMEALVEENYDDIEAICGGCCACATCHIYISDNWVDKFGEQGDDEKMLLESVDNYREVGSRLSCQMQITPELDGLEIEIAPPE